MRERLFGPDVKREGRDGVFSRLRDAALEQSLTGEFPSWLLADILAVADDPQRHAAQTDLVERLIAEIADYDPYAGAGCFGTSVSAAQIQATLREIVG
ncbi:hypothetical protein JFN93_13840 [Geomonas sp. Red875]|uniref:Uncharacterized protein n=1 Tax=Geomesophilobacter sediminis TaxID=2798584 RepID=A0A8J7LYZ4_9BACT|nr:hypothetical protein [Geomesophilobacter sediminis]